MSKSYDRMMAKQFDTSWEYDEAKRQQRKEDRKKRDARRGGKRNAWQPTED